MCGRHRGVSPLKGPGVSTAAVVIAGKQGGKQFYVQCRHPSYQSVDHRMCVEGIGDKDKAADWAWGEHCSCSHCRDAGGKAILRTVETS